MVDHRYTRRRKRGNHEIDVRPNFQGEKSVPYQIDAKEVCRIRQMEPETKFQQTREEKRGLLFRLKENVFHLPTNDI